jgi:putative ABC transport system permease protein
MKNLLQDWLYACRKLRRSFGSTISAVLIVAVAAGTNTAIYTLADNYYYGDMVAWAKNVALVGARFKDPALNYFFRLNNRVAEPLEANLQSFDRLARVSYFFMTLGGVDRPIRGNGLRVGPGIQDVLPMGVVRGRSFQSHDFAVDAEKVVLLDYRTWRSVFAGDEGVIDRRVDVNGVPYRVIGVLPEGWEYEHGKYDIVAASSFREPRFLGLAGPNVWLVGRLKAGVTPAQANAEVRSMEAGLTTAAPPRYFNEVTLGVRPLGERSHTLTENQLDMLISAGSIILLTAALNLCGAALVQLYRRRGEFAARAALGGSRWRLVRLFTMEMGTVILGGYALGVLLGYSMVQTIRTQFTDADRGLLAILSPDDIHLTWRSVLLTLAACLLVLGCIALTAFIFVSSGRLTSLLKEQSRSVSGSRAYKWASGSLLFLQVTSTCALLVVGAFFVVSMDRASRYDYGYQIDGVIQTEVFLPYYRFPTGEAAVVELVTMMEGVTDAIRAVPGVQQAGISKLPFLHAGELHGVRLPSTPADVSNEHLPQAREGIVGPGFLEMSGVTLLRGQLFSVSENRADAERVIVINQAFAEQFFEGQEPLDQFVDVRDRKYRVIGVVSNVRRWQATAGLHQGLRVDAAEPSYYVQNAQYGGRATAWVFIKTNAFTGRFEQSIRAAIREVDPDIVVSSFGGLREHLIRSENTFRLIVFMQALVAGMGALLSCVAIYAAVSYWVTQRQREIGIRLALGAQPAGIGGGVLWYTVRLVAPAVLLGAALVYVGLVHLDLLRNQLYLVDIAHPQTYLLSVAGLVVVAIFAAMHPTLRAAWTSPSNVLRED